MNKYFWKKQFFFNDLEKELLTKKPQAIKIASAYISYNGAVSLKNIINQLSLNPEDIEIYCSSKFNDQEPAKLLNFLSTFATVIILNNPFLHSKVYEIHHKKEIITYCGSANLTEGGLQNNLEMMVKTKAVENQLSDFWDELWENGIEVTDEVIMVYKSYPLPSTSDLEQKQLSNIEGQLTNIYAQQVIDSHYPDLTGFYFRKEDYETFTEKNWQDASQSIRLKRKATQEKIVDLHSEIESFAEKLDLYPHYLQNHITNGIEPSIYNFGRVTGIWVRYGKHKSELNQLGSSSFGREKSPFEQFHKHACLQFSFDAHGMSIGMFHSTANDGVDRGHVRDHWAHIKQAISKEYDQLVGFVWSFYDAKNAELIGSFDFDEGTPEEFITFYLENDVDGYESFCMRHYDMDDIRIKTDRAILHEVKETFKAILPLHKAMSFRIPVHSR